MTLIWPCRHHVCVSGFSSSRTQSESTERRSSERIQLCASLALDLLTRCDRLRASGPGRGVKRVFRRGWRSGARKAKAKWWTNVKHRCAAVSSVSTASMRPDLEQVDGVLFVSFTAKVWEIMCNATQTEGSVRTPVRFLVQQEEKINRICFVFMVWNLI